LREPESGGRGQEISSRPQREQRYLRRAVKPEGHPHGADAAIHVKLHLPQAEPPLDILAAHFRKSHCANQWQANLAAMGVSAEHERNGRACGIDEQLIRVVGCVAHNNDRLVRDVADGIGDGDFRRRLTLHGIVEASEPDSARRALDRQVGVAEQLNAVVGECLGDLLRPNHEVVITQHRVALAAGESVEDTGALPRGADSEFCRRKLTGDEVAGNEHRIGIEAVDPVDDFADKERLSEFVQMDVADLHDAETVEGLRKTREKDVAGRDFDEMALDFTGIEGETAESARASDEEAASRDREPGE
jgi:hypothetical protein